MSDNAGQKLVESGVGERVLKNLEFQGLYLSTKDLTLSVIREWEDGEPYPKIRVKYLDPRFAYKECEQDFLVTDDDFFLNDEEVLVTADQMHVIDEIFKEGNDV